jgi:hypothetical protein
MRYMMMVKSPESAGPPPPALMAAIAKLGEEATNAGVLVETGGLGPSVLGAQVRLSGGKVTVHDGPFSEAKELVGGYAVYELPSKDEAIKWATRFMEVHRDNWEGWDGESEVREVVYFAPVAPQQ